jgi:predicted Na+-dependent transporter
MLVGFNWSDAFTMGIEVALRNGNLAIALAATLFPATRADDPVGRGVFFTTLFYAGASLVLAMFSVGWRQVQLRWQGHAAGVELPEPEPHVDRAKY